MKRKKTASLYQQLVVKTLVLLVFPFLAVIVFLSAQMLHDSNISYQTNINLVTEQSIIAREKHLEAIYGLANQITSNNSLRGFLHVEYAKDNLFYYASQIASIVSPKTLDATPYSSRIYFSSDSIPRGFGIFYHINDIDKGAVADFISGPQDQLWVLPTQAERYPSAFTPFAGHYTYMRKVYTGDSLLYLLTISISEQEMDSFAAIAKNGSFGAPPYIDADDTLYLLDYTGSPKPGELSLQDYVDELKAKGNVVREQEFPLFPQRLVFTFGPNMQNGFLIMVFGLIILFCIGLIVLVILFIRKIFAGIYQALGKFKASADTGFTQRIAVRGDDEIATMTRAFNVQIDKIQDLMQLTARQTALVKESQLQALRQQINPHFMYNTLELFSYQMLKNNLTTEADAMVAFSRMLRYSIASDNPFSTLADELAQVENYMSIQRIKYSNMEFEVILPQGMEQLQLPRFILQPIIENSCSHGYYGKPLHIVLCCVDNGSYVTFEIYDNGKGMTGQETARLNQALANKEYSGAVGIGLGNINARLCLYYSDTCRLTVTSRESRWTFITFQIPKVFKEEESDG